MILSYVQDYWYVAVAAVVLLGVFYALSLKYPKVRKYWYVFLIFGVSVLYLLTLRSPRKTITDLGPKPSNEPPEPVVSPDYLSNLRKRKKENDEKIDKMSRIALIDDINTDYE